MAKFKPRTTRPEKGNKYYIQIRTYKSIKGVQYFSNWSAKKSVVTKK